MLHLMASSAAMPELSLRMSKKIAQLTKVIYHLNNKNEDNELDLEDMAQQYEVEIEQILKDTADKVNFFKLQLEEARDDRKIRELQKQLESKYEDEKRRCLAELEAVRKRSADKEGAIQNAAAKQIDSLSMQVDQLQEQLQQRIREIHDIGKDAHSSSKELQEALQKARVETEEAILAGNKKYNNMLAERLRTEDELTGELEQFKTKLEVETSSRQEAERTLKDREAQWQAKCLSTSEAVAANEAALRRRLEELEGQLTEATRCAREDARRMGDDLEAAAFRTAELEEALKASAGDVREKASEVERLMAELQSLSLSSSVAAKDLREQISKAEEQLSMLQAAAVKDNDASQRTASMIASERDELAAKLSAAERDLKDVSTSLESSRKDLSALKSYHDQALQQQQKRIVALEEEVKKVQQAGLNDAALVAQKLKDDTERRLREAEAEHLRAMAVASKEAEGRLAASKAEAQEKYTLALERRLAQEVKEARESLESDHAASLDRLLKDSFGSSEAWKQERAYLERKLLDTEGLLSDEKARHASSEAQAAKRARWAGEKQIELERDIQASEVVVAELRAELSRLQGDLQQALSEARDRGSSASTLEQELDKERTQHVAEMQAVLQSHAAALLKKDTEWEARMAEQITEALLDQERRLHSEMTALRNELTSSGAEAQAETEARLRREAAERDAQASAEREALKAQHASELAGECRRASEELEVVQRAHQSQLDAFADEARARQSGKERGLREEMEASLANLKKQHEAEEAALRSQQAQEAEAALRKAKEEQARAVAEAEAKERIEAAVAMERARGEWWAVADKDAAVLKQSHETAILGLSNKHGAELEALRGQGVAREGELQAILQAMEKNGLALESAKRNLEDSVQGLQQRLEDLQVTMSNRAAEATDKLFRVQQESSDEKDRLLREHREEKEALAAQHGGVLSSLSHDMQEALALHGERFSELECEFLTIKAKYDAREPREEDVARIHQLESALYSAEEQVRTAEERMQQLRAELLLREDNYNKHFKNGGAGDKVLNVGSAMKSGADVMDWMGLGGKRDTKGSTGGPRQLSKDGASGRMK